MQCYKCHGKGHLVGFAHVAQGICFQCKGSGILPDSKKKNKGFSLAFIDGFLQPGYFPLDQSGMTKIMSLSFIGHATAEEQVLVDAEYYYIGKPICRSSIWYKIPIAEFTEFVLHWNKVFKTKNINDLEIHQSRSVLSEILP